MVMTVEEIVPLVSSLTPKERVRLLRLITKRQDADDAAVYTAVPPTRDEFSSADDVLGWDAGGWEEID
jgi:hypothetical protein